MSKLLFELENIGKLRYAKIKLNGLTVIAGENDTGKSTIGKALVALLKTEFIARQKYYKKRKDYFKNRKFGFKRLRELLFDNFLKVSYELYPQYSSKNSYIKITFNGKYLKVFWDKNKNEWEFDKKSLTIKDKLYYKDITYIQSPLIWDLQSFFNSILQMKTQVEMEEDIKFNFSYPYLLWDLYGKLIKKRIEYISNFHSAQRNFIKDIIDGEFIRRSSNDFVFRRKGIDIPLIDVAHGIKSFGILQVLLENGYISDKGILVFDEPEVHLHPNWQVEYAKLIINFTKYGVKILVSSHSPYFIQALNKFATEERIENKVNFYVAEENKIFQKENNAKTLQYIFYKLSKPLHNLVWE